MSDTYHKQLDSHIIERYRREVSDGEIDLDDVAAWAVHNRIYEPPLKTSISLCRKELAEAMRSKTFVDQKGREIRSNYCVRRPAVRADGTKYTQTVWASIDVATHPFMEEAFQQMRAGIADSAYRATTYVAHYNEFRRGENPEIQLPLDFTDDVADRMQATDYQPADFEEV